MIWHLKHPEAIPEMLGIVPSFLSESDPRPAHEQIEENYAHGGGWRPLKGFKLLPSGDLQYPSDPIYRLIAETTLRQETIRFYERSWLLILQSDGSYEVSRID